MNTKVQYFAPEEVWRGGFYEIEMELGVPSDERLSLVLEKVWSHKSLEGCYLDRSQEPHAQTPVDPREHAHEGHLYGIAHLPNGVHCACGTYVCRLESGADTPSCDFVAFYLPLGSIATAYPIGGYPFTDTKQAGAWRTVLDNWLVELGHFVYKQTRFELALVGFEVDFPTVSSTVVRRNGIPSERYDGYLWPVDSRLEWYPPTNWNIIRLHSGDSS